MVGDYVAPEIKDWSFVQRTIDLNKRLTSHDDLSTRCLVLAPGVNVYKVNSSNPIESLGLPESDFATLKRGRGDKEWTSPSYAIRDEATLHLLPVSDPTLAEAVMDYGKAAVEYLEHRLGVEVPTLSWNAVGSSGTETDIGGKGFVCDGYVALHKYTMTKSGTNGEVMRLQSPHGKEGATTVYGQHTPSILMTAGPGALTGFFVEALHLLAYGKVELGDHKPGEAKALQQNFATAAGYTLAREFMEQFDVPGAEEALRRLPQGQMYTLVKPAMRFIGSLGDKNPVAEAYRQFMESPEGFKINALRHLKPEEWVELARQG